MTFSSITIQIAPESQPSPPSWIGEVTVFAQVLIHEGILNTIQNRVCFARARFGQYDGFVHAPELDFHPTENTIIQGYRLSLRQGFMM